MDEKLARTIGEATRAARLARKLTQEDAASLIGISLEFFARIERGKTLPSTPTLRKIAIALRVPADVLLGIDQLSDAARARLEPEEAPDAAIARRLVRRVMRATPSAIRLVNLVLLELEGSGSPAKTRKRATSDWSPTKTKRGALALVRDNDAQQISKAAEPRTRSRRSRHPQE